MSGNLRVILDLVNRNFDRNLSASVAQLHRFRQRVSEVGRNINTVQGNISRASAGVSAFSGSMLGLASKGHIAIAAITALGVAGLDSLKRFKEFEQQMANFKGILGVDSEAMKYFEAEAVRLGATTTQTSSQVADAFTKIAGKLPQLLDCREGLVQVTEASITLAEAAGITVDEAGTALANAINQMGASASDATNYINILAAGSRNGAGDINYLTEAMKKIGSTTASVGMSFEQTVASIEMLAKTGVVAGSAGRQLRAVIGKLEKQMDSNLKPSIVGIDQALENLAKKQLDSAQYFHMFGVENQNAARTLVENREEYKKLTNTVTGTNTAIDQAKTRTATLTGAVKRLDSAWEELCLTVTGGDFWKNIVDGAAEALGVFNDFVLKVKDFEAWQEKKGKEKAKSKATEYQKTLDDAATDLTSKINPLTKTFYTVGEAYEEVLANLPKYLPEITKTVNSNTWEDKIRNTLDKSSNIPTGADIPSLLSYLGKVGAKNLIKSIIPSDTTNQESAAIMNDAMYYLAGKIDAANKKVDEKEPLNLKEAIGSFDTSTKGGLKNLISYLEGLKGQYGDDPLMLNQIESLLENYKSQLDDFGKYIPKVGSIDYLQDQKRKNRIEYNKATSNEDRLRLNLDYNNLDEQIKKINDRANIKVNVDIEELKDVTQEIETQKAILKENLRQYNKAESAGDEGFMKFYKEGIDQAKNKIKELEQKQDDFITKKYNKNSINIIKHLISEIDKEIANTDLSNGVPKVLIDKKVELNTLLKAISDVMNSLDPEYQQEKLEEYIANLEKQEKLEKSLLTGGFGAAMDLGDSIESLNKLDWDELSAWDKFKAIIEPIMSTTQAVNSLIDAWNELKDVTKLVDEGAQIAAITADATAVTTAETEKTAAVVAGQSAQTTAVTTGSAIRTAALKAEMAAGSAAAYAYIPFAGVGMAAAQIAQFEGMILAAASIPTFADGGIFQSPFTSGDKNLARLNGGEMILNKGQQANLFKLLDNGMVSGNNHIEFKLRGSDIYGSLTNYNKKYSKLR